MDISTLLVSMVGQFPILGTILGILGVLVVLGQVVVALTPSPADDAAYAKIMEIPILGAVLKSLAAFAPIQKKGG